MGRTPIQSLSFVLPFHIFFSEFFIPLLVHLIYSVFFSSIGFLIPLSVFFDWSSFGWGLLYSLIAIVGKLFTGLLSYDWKNNALVVGWAMVGRGELGILLVVQRSSDILRICDVYRFIGKRSDHEPNSSHLLLGANYCHLSLGPSSLFHGISLTYSPFVFTSFFVVRNLLMWLKVQTMQMLRMSLTNELKMLMAEF